MNDTEFGDGVGSHSHELIQAVCGTALTLVLAVSLGGWLLLGQGSAGPPTDGGSAGRMKTTAPATAAGRLRAGDVTGEAVGGRPRSSLPRYYIVASQEHADAVLLGIHEAEAAGADAREPLPDARVVLVDSEEEEARFFLALHEQDAVRGGIGLPAIRVVDLRAIAPTAVPGAFNEQPDGEVR